MRTSSAKAKGRRPMLWLRDRLLATFSQLQPDDIRVTASGTPGPDLQLSPAAQQLFPYAVESKNHERCAVSAAIKQAESHAQATGLAPLLLFTKNRRPKYVAIRAERMQELATVDDNFASGIKVGHESLWAALDAMRATTRRSCRPYCVYFTFYVALEAESFLDLVRRAAK